VAGNRQSKINCSQKSAPDFLNDLHVKAPYERTGAVVMAMLHLALVVDDDIIAMSLQPQTRPWNKSKVVPGGQPSLLPVFGFEEKSKNEA
jgi:hypothetical protein